MKKDRLVHPWVYRSLDWVSKNFQSSLGGRLVDSGREVGGFSETYEVKGDYVDVNGVKIVRRS